MLLVHFSDMQQMLLLNTVNVFVLIFIFSFSEGSNLTPAHHFPDFRFKTYAPVAFRYFRELFGIRPDDYLVRTERCVYPDHPVQQEHLSMPVNKAAKKLFKSVAVCSACSCSSFFPPCSHCVPFCHYFLSHQESFTSSVRLCFFK